MDLATRRPRGEQGGQVTQEPTHDDYRVSRVSIRDVVIRRDILFADFRKNVRCHGYPGQFVRRARAIERLRS